MTRVLVRRLLVLSFAVVAAAQTSWEELRGRRKYQREIPDSMNEGEHWPKSLTMSEAVGIAHAAIGPECYDYPDLVQNHNPIINFGASHMFLLCV
jgi:hypothetical protein